MNKFAKETINTYSKKNSISASKHTQESLQVSLNFDIVKTNVMKNSLMTSTIYSVSYSIKKYILSPTQKKRKRKKEQKHKKARNIFLLANNLELYTFLSLLSNLLYFLILLIHVMTSYYHFLFSIFIFSKTVHAKMLVSHLCMSM